MDSASRCWADPARADAVCFFSSPLHQQANARTDPVCVFSSRLAYATKDEVFKPHLVVHLAHQIHWLWMVISWELEHSLLWIYLRNFSWFVWNRVSCLGVSVLSRMQICKLVLLIRVLRVLRVCSWKEDLYCHRVRMEGFVDMLMLFFFMVIRLIRLCSYSNLL